VRGLANFLNGLAVDTLQWSLGLFCAVIGALMLVVPHQLNGAIYASITPHLTAWGLLGLAAGVALLSVPVTRPGPVATAVVHGIVGAALVGLGFGFASTRSWNGLVLYGVLGAGTALGGCLPGARHSAPGLAGDLLSLLYGVAACLAGVVILGSGLVDAGYFAVPHRALLPYFGVLWLGAGPFLAWAQVQPLPPRPATRTAHLLAGLSLVAFGGLVSLPLRSWTGVALNTGCGLVIAGLPWLRPLFDRADAAALRTRLSLALALATSITLILAVAVVTEQEEGLAAEQVRQMQRIEAVSIAQDVADYLDFNIARAAAVADMAGREPMAAGPQGQVLASTRDLYPDVTAFATLSRAGEPLARTGNLPLDGVMLARLAAEIGRLTEPQLVLRFSRQLGRPLLLLSGGVRGLDGQLSGVLVAIFDTTSLAHRIDRPGSRVTLADGRGQTVAALDRSEGRPPPGLPLGWDRAVAAGRPIPMGESLTAFAGVPRFGWAVAVERPQAAALAGVRRGRDRAFILLLVCAGLAALAGIVTARRIARPLGTLADAVDQLAAGNPHAPVEASRIAEITRLAAAFGELRDRLTARTAESERLAAELRARAEALAETDRLKDEFLAMLAHELRNPLGAISNASHLLTHLKPAEPPMARAVAVVERQVHHLVRMVDDLLDVSRITRGKVDLRRQPLDLVEVVRQTVEGHRALAEGRGIELAVTLPAGLLPLDADLTRLEQVLSNLLRNAAKFTEPGGRIDVSVAADGGEAVVRVADSGVGIAPELLPRIFDLFAQGDQTLDRRGAGLGIGLTMVRRLVELHGGRVEAASAGPGQGAELTVRLPLAPAPVERSL
jgi:signal transduction histidine kinase